MRIVLVVELPFAYFILDLISTVAKREFLLLFTVQLISLSCLWLCGFDSFFT